MSDAGYFRLTRGDQAAAETHLTRAVRRDPAFAPAWANLGVLYAKTGRPEDAVRAFSRSLPPAQAAYNVSVLLAGQGRADEARVYVRSALARDPDLQPARDLFARLTPPPAAEPGGVTRSAGP